MFNTERDPRSDEEREINRKAMDNVNKNVKLIEILIAFCSGSVSSYADVTPA